MMPPIAARTSTLQSSLVPGVVARLLEEGPEEAFDRLTRLASMALHTPIAVLSLISHARLLIKSSIGMPEPWASMPETPLPHAMFRHALATSKPFVVSDVRGHPLTKDMQLGPGREGAAYCGVPIIFAERRVVGVLSVINNEPRDWTDAEVTFLQDLAGSAGQEIESRLGAAEAPEPEESDAALPVLSQLTDGMVVLDSDWRITVVNPRAERILRRDASELVGTSLLDSFSGIVHTVFHQEFVRALAEQCAVEIEDRCGCVDAWLEVRAFPHREGLAVQLRDITARRNAEEALRQSEARYRAVFQESPDPIFFAAADSSFVECNRAMLETFGYTREQLFRLRLEDLFIEEDDVKRLRETLDESSGVREFECTLRNRESGKMACRLTVHARRDAAGEVVGWHGEMHDDTLRRTNEQALLHGVFHDPLTGLPNRALFMDRLERTIVQSNRKPDHRFAVMFVDLDKFKLVNDTLGHHAGDELLISAARRLEACVRQEDTVARMGGDEFAILLDDVTDIRDATRIADRINLELALPFQVGRREVACSASIGIAYNSAGYRSADQVLQDSDAAMYRAKQGGRARYEVFDTDMHRRALAQLRLEDELRSALERNEFRVVYQPVVVLESGAVSSVEALVRWAHPERGFLAPADFIGTAEQTGLVGEIGWFVLREACRQARQWLVHLESGTTSDFHVSVNVATRQFLESDFVARLDRLLVDVGLDPSRLHLELTEKTIMEDTSVSSLHLEMLRERGVRICLDDFGTGASSIQFLQGLPLASMKIDRSIVRGVETDEIARGVIRTIIAVARSLSVDAIAEGVETLEQLTALRALGAAHAQGWLFSQPLDPAAASELLLESPRT
jgi:diguanylate cyclase (GGDEF)-like protein/PAS domain S-box-containing protein